jgi:hypothetical protein
VVGVGLGSNPGIILFQMTWVLVLITIEHNIIMTRLVFSFGQHVHSLPIVSWS